MTNSRPKRPGALAPRSRRLPPLALTYHGVADVPLHRDRYGLFVRPRDLRRQVDRLRAWGYELLPFGRFADRVAAGRGEGAAALTFDDGLVDNLDNLVPLLSQAEAPATVFPVSGWLGRRHPDAPWTRILTGDELRELHRNGVEIGAHTATHPELTALPAPRAAAELREGREQLEALLGVTVDLLAYPYGEANPAVVAAAGAAGFRAACRTQGRGSWSAPLDLPRQDMYNGANLLELRLKRDNVYEPLMRKRSARAVRKLVRTSRLAVR